MKGGSRVNEFESIYRSYFGDVYLYLCKLTGDANLADELAGETFFRAMRAMKGFRGDCDLRVWLCRIARNCYYSHLKKQRRTAKLDVQDMADPSESMEEILSRNSEAFRIHELAHALPDPYKEVFMLRALGELGFREIGKIFGRTENWACVVYHRARRKIIEAMQADAGGDLPPD